MGHKRIPPQTIAEIKSPAYNNLSDRQLATLLGIGKSSVQKYRAASGKPAKPAKRGRPPVTSKEQRKALRAKEERSGGSTWQLVEWSAKQGYRKISRGTVASVLKGGKKPRVYKPVKSGRRLSDRNQQLRLQFARQHVNDDFEHVVFVDQKVVSMGYDEARGQAKMWQQKGSNKQYVKSTSPAMFLFYGAVAKGHKSQLVRVQMKKGGKGRGCSSFGSEEFIQAFKHLWAEVQGWYPPGQKFKVVLDNAKQHVSHTSRAQLQGLGVSLLEGFPPQSYDINLIEVVWGHLQQQLVGRTFTKKEKYEQEIREAWSRVQVTTINKLVAKHKQQLQKIIAQKGGWVDY